jgi:hypothetical protein
MQWLSTTYGIIKGNPPPACMGCYKVPAVCKVRLVEYQGNEPVTVDVSLCSDCDDRARQGTLDLKYGHVGRER